MIGRRECCVPWQEHPASDLKHVSFTRRNPHYAIRYTRRWLQVLSRRNNVPEKWLTGALASSSTARSEAIVARLAEEQRELKEYESMVCDGDGLDSAEKVSTFFII